MLLSSLLWPIVQKRAQAQDFEAALRRTPDETAVRYGFRSGEREELEEILRLKKEQEAQILAPQGTMEHNLAAETEMGRAA